MKRNIRVFQKCARKTNKPLKINKPLVKKEKNIIKKYLKRLGGSYTYQFSSPWRIGFEQIIWIFDNSLFFGITSLCNHDRKKFFYIQYFTFLFKNN